MKRSWFNSSFFIILISLAFSSCDPLGDEPQIPKTADKYLVRYDNVDSATKEQVEYAYDLLGKEFEPAAFMKAKVKSGVIIFKISYKTTYKNQEKLASGLVCVPMAKGPFPILSFQNGTNTQNTKAPSMNYNDQLFKIIQYVASAGYVVAIPDYLGFGTSSTMFHPYMDKATTVQTVTDMYRAVAEMMVTSKLDIEMTKNLYLMGYSQGGWATLALQQEIENKLPTEWTIKASACGGNPFNLTALNNYVLTQTSYPMPYYIGYMMNSYIKGGGVSITYTDIFNPPYAEKISNMYDGTRDGDYLNSNLTTKISELFTFDYRTKYATDAKFASVRTALANNSVEAWNSKIPMMFYHGTGDTYIPSSLTQEQYDAFKAKGVPESQMTLKILPFLDHNTTLFPFGIGALQWLMEK